MQPGLGRAQWWLQTLRRAGILRLNHGVTSAAAICDLQDRKDLDCNTSVLTVLELHKRNTVRSTPLESCVSKVVTTRSHLMIAARECCEQMHRGITSSSNTHRTRHPGMNSLFGSPLHSRVVFGISRVMASIRPRDSVGAAWTTVRR